MSEIDKTWHLAQTEDEIKVTEFELNFWRVFNGFLRWQEECERYANNSRLTASEISILHIIRMKERPKSINDIGRILNRSDNFNIQYSIRKLTKMGLVKKIESSPQHKRSAAYQITDKGLKNTDNLAAMRKKILMSRFIGNSESNLEDMTKTIIRLKAIYDEAEQTAASYIVPETD